MYMLLIEFSCNLTTDGLNLLKYRHVDCADWYYLYIDIETLNLLLQNFGIMSTLKIPTQPVNIDNLSTGELIRVKYCDAPILLYCGNNAAMYLPILEQQF